MLGFATRCNVQIGVIAENAGSLHWVVPVVLSESLYCIEGLLIHEITLLNPAFAATGRAHPGEAFFALQNLDAVAVLYRSHAVIDGRHLVAQRRLRRRDIGHFEHVV